jgi:competence protein ComEC
MKNRKLIWTAFLVLLLVGAGALAYYGGIFGLKPVFADYRKGMEVVFLDVGQGDAILIKTLHGQNILIDGGEDKAVIKRLGEELPWWDKRIDLTILTHPHSDHVGGLIDVLRRYDVSTIIYSGASHNSPDYLAWLRIIQEKNISLRTISRRQKVLLADNAYLDFLYPTALEDIGMEKNLNNTSLIAKLVYGETKFLFMGDAEIAVESKLILSGADLKADVIKLGHHGSDTSSGEELLRQVSPDYAVIAVGVGNKFGHPSPRVVKRLGRLPAKILRTDYDGNIKFKSDGRKVELID